MGEHASALVLDTLAAGLPTPAAVKAHVDGCRECTHRLDALRTKAAKVLNEPEARRRLGLLHNQLAREPSPSRWAWPVKLVAVAVPLLVVVLVLVTQPFDGGTSRVKGQAVLEVMLDGGAVSSASVGSRVTLTAGGGGAAFGAVFSVDSNGEVDIVWPPKGDISGRLEGGAREPLAQFEVTPGSFTLHAFFSNEALSLDALLRMTADAGLGAPIAPAQTSVVSKHLEVTP